MEWLKTKTGIIVSGILLLIGAFTIGRFSAPERIKTEVETVKVDKVVYTEAHSKTTIQKNTDGSSTEVIISDTNSKDTAHSNSTDNTTEITNKRHNINVSVMFGNSLPLSASAIYGGSVTIPLIGPFTASGWFLTDKTFGGALGFNF